MFLPKAVTYHEPTVLRLFMIGHSLGCLPPCLHRHPIIVLVVDQSVVPPTPIILHNFVCFNIIPNILRYLYAKPRCNNKGMWLQAPHHRAGGGPA